MKYYIIYTDWGWDLIVKHPLDVQGFSFMYKFVEITKEECEVLSVLR